MNRIDRLAAIMIQLQSKRLVKAQDIASRFSISLRTVYRDVHALQEAGVPVIGEAGTGYSLMEGYKLPPVMFNIDEATSLLTAGKLMQAKTDAALSKHYTSALEKIKAVLRYNEKGHIEDIEEHIAVVQHPSFQFQLPDDLHLQTILKTIAQKKVIEITYTSIEKNEITHRKIEPIGIYNLGSHWHLAAFCNLRNDYRNFRTDKIEKLMVTEEMILKTHPSLQEFLSKTQKEKDLTKVVIEADKKIMKYMGEQKYYHGFFGEEDAGDYLRVTFLCGSLMGLSRWLMMFGDYIRILEPAELNNMISRIAENILKKIEETQMLLT